MRKVIVSSSLCTYLMFQLYAGGLSVSESKEQKRRKKTVIVLYYKSVQTFVAVPASFIRMDPVFDQQQLHDGSTSYKPYKKNNRSQSN